MNSDSRDSAWMRWDQVLRSILQHINRNDLKAGLVEIDSFLSSETVPEVRSSALGMKADIQADLGAPEAARETLLIARSLLGPGFGKYVHELSLAETYRKEKRLDEAVAWYRNALRTGVEGKISAGGALKKFLDLRDVRYLSEEDRQLCVTAARQSWRVLGLPGVPDPENLAGVVATLIESESNPPERP